MKFGLGRKMRRPDGSIAGSRAFMQPVATSMTGAKTIIVMIDRVFTTGNLIPLGYLEPFRTSVVIFRSQSQLVRESGPASAAH